MLDSNNYFDKVLLELGFEQNYAKTYNVKNFGPRVIEYVKFESNRSGRRDFLWLCNKLSNCISSVSDNCIDNLRIARLSLTNDDIPAEYKALRGQGCCGFFDRRLINPVTGSVFVVGFNYGH